MVDKVTIQKIVNGFTLSSDWYAQNSNTVFCKDWLAIIKHLDGIYGNVERELINIREEKAKEQIRSKDIQAAKES